LRPFKIAFPSSVDQACDVAGDNFADARLLAGGSDLLTSIKERIEVPDLLVDLKRIKGLDGIAFDEKGITIGGLCTLSDVAAHEKVRKHYFALSEATEQAATPQIRNVATIAGNICQRPRCWYFRSEDYLCLKKGGFKCYARWGENEYHTIFDNDFCCAPNQSNVAPILKVYDGTLEIVSTSGTREVEIEDFFTGPTDDISRENILEPGEVVTRIHLPTPAPSSGCAYFEARERQSFDWALASASVRLTFSGKKVSDARVVLGAVAPVPLRRRASEKLLVGNTISEETIDAACKAALEGAILLEHNAYKSKLVEGLLARALRAAAERGKGG